MNELYFKKNQKLLLSLINTEAGRHLLNLKKDDCVVKTTPNSVHIYKGESKKGVILEAKFFLYEAVAKVFLPIITKFEITNDYSYNSLLHHSGLETNKKLPLVLFTSTDFYVGAGDGFVGNDQVSTNWSTTRDSASGNAADATSAQSSRSLASYRLSDNTYAIYRDYFPVNTSSLTIGAVISAATFSFYTDPTDGLFNPDAVMVATTQASISTLATSDFSLVGSTALSDVVTASGTSYKVWTLNSTGREAISLTGTTKMGLRNYTYDFQNSAPLINNNWCRGNYSEQTGTSQDPYYSITYTTQGGAFLLNMI